MANQMSSRELGKVCQLMDFLNEWKDQLLFVVIEVRDADNKLGTIKTDDGESYLWFPDTED